MRRRSSGLDTTLGKLDTPCLCVSEDRHKVRRIQQQQTRLTKPPNHTSAVRTDGSHAPKHTPVVRGQCILESNHPEPEPCNRCARGSLSCDVNSYLKIRQGHLGLAELAARLSVFTFPVEVIRNLLPHHSLFTFSQRTGHLEERTHIQVVLHRHR